MKGDDISERLLDFAARIIKLCNHLGKRQSVSFIGKQLIRSGTSVGANYEEARGAESNSDFTHKLGIALKEMRETRYWLKLVRKSEIIPENRLKGLIQESEELCAILITSIKTVKDKQVN